MALSAARPGIRRNSAIINAALSRLARHSSEVLVKGSSSMRLARQSTETLVKGDSSLRLARQSVAVLVKGDSNVRLARQSVEVLRLTTGFAENYNRTDREIVGDNGWYITHTSPSTGIQAITSDRLRPVAATSGFPGSSGTIGNPICHDVVHADPNIADVSFDIVTGAVGSSCGWLYFVMAATKAGGAPQTIDTGVLLRMLITGSNNTLIQKITSSNSTTDHSPGTFPSIPASSTTNVRCKLTRSTGVLQVFLNGSGTATYTSASGDFSSLSGSIVGFQFSNAYASCPIEVDNVVAV